MCPYCGCRWFFDVWTPFVRCIDCRRLYKPIPEDTPHAR
jgi:hypothetical protein